MLGQLGLEDEELVDVLEGAAAAMAPVGADAVGAGGASSGAGGAVAEAAAQPPPKVRKTMDAIFAKAASPSTAVSAAAAGAVGSGPATQDKALLKLVEQMEARIRDLEALAYFTAAVPKVHGLVVGAEEGVAFYLSVIKDDPTLGAPHVFVAVRALQKYMATVTTTDEALTCKLAAVALLVANMQQADSDELASWVRFFRVSKMFHETGTVEKARIQFKFDGAITLPNPQQAAQVLEAFRQKDLVAISKLAAMCYEMIEGEPTAVGRPAPIDKVLRSIVCMSGGEMKAGRAPRGGAVWAVKGKGKGKGRKGGRA